MHMCTNDYLRCSKCEVHDRVCKNVNKYTKKHVPRFLIFEALQSCTIVLSGKNYVKVKNVLQFDTGPLEFIFNTNHLGYVTLTMKKKSHSVLLFVFFYFHKNTNAM